MSQLFDPGPPTQTPDMVWMQVFRALATRWPMKFSNAKYAELVEIWKPEARSVDLDALVPTAKKFAGGFGTYPPTAREFAIEARKLAKKRFDAVTPIDKRETDVPYGFSGRRFWFEKPGPPEGWRRLDSERAWANVLPDGTGTVGISEREMDQLHTGERKWGWL